MSTISSGEVKKIRLQLDSQRYQDRGALLRVVSGSMRFQILSSLHIHRRGLSMLDLSNILGASLSRLSHQMRILMEYRVVEKRLRKGRTVYRLRFLELIRRLT